jgi:hypothetical protein
VFCFREVYTNFVVFPKTVDKIVLGERSRRDISSFIDIFFSGQQIKALCYEFCADA